MTTLLDRLEELNRRATQGIWESVQHDDPRGQPSPFYCGLICTVEHSPDRYLSVVGRDGFRVSAEEWPINCAIIAESRNALPALLAAARALERCVRAEERRRSRLKDGSPAARYADSRISEACAALAPLMKEIDAP